MIMSSFLKNRRSIREFKKKKVDVDTLEKIKSYLQVLVDEDNKENIKFKLYENGENLYESLKGIGGYAGVMIQSPHYISVETMNNEDKTIIYSAYFMEELISKLNKLGLNTCWISLDNVDSKVKEKALGEKRGEVNYLLGIGYAKPKNPFIEEPISERISIEELVFSEKIGVPASLEELENRGLSDLFYYARFAPSAKNKQPWRFLLEDIKTTLLLENTDSEDFNLMDAGIMMYYFQALAETIGIKNQWKLIEGSNETTGYKYIAEIKL